MTKQPEYRAFIGGGGQQRSMTHFTPELIEENKRKAEMRRKMLAQIKQILKK